MPTGNGGQGSALQAQLRRMLGIKSKPDNGTHTAENVLRFDDADALANDRTDVPDVAQVAPIVVLHNVVATHGVSSHTAPLLLGSTANFYSINNDTIDSGSYFTDADVTAHKRVALLGPSVASDLTEGSLDSVVGQQIRINGQPFTVAGILGAKGYSGQQDLDDRIVVPMTAAEDALYGYSPYGLGELSAIALESTSSGALPAAQAEVQNLMDTRDHVSAINSHVIVFNSSAVLGAAGSASHTLTILLGAVAGISLLVGGIGVMNIMLVSVTERTREIGIRKAIGGTGADIIGQFLTEAVIVSAVGGVIGMGFGWIATRFQIAGVHPIIAPWSIWLAIGVSLATGLIFGFYPASRAAALRPIQALRYE
jgi:putative ABC transport system permease protein